MKIAVISDTHIGNPKSCIVNKEVFDPKGAYKKFKDIIFNYTKSKPLDYLILNGDVLDFSINSFENSIKIGRPFFQQLKKDKLTREVILIPGNHDKQIWDGVQWDTSVIGNLSNFQNPDPFKRIQAGIIDLTKKGKLELEDVPRNAKGHYGDIFIKGLYKNKRESIPTSIVYPNLYIKTKNDSILVTHGHMIETSWVLASEIFKGVQSLPEVDIPEEAGLKDLEELNVPITSMICTGTGQAGDVSQLFLKIQNEAFNHNTEALSVTLDKALPNIRQMLDLKPFGNFIAGLVIPLVKKFIIKNASTAEDTRYNQDKFKSPTTQRLLTNFFNATVIEMNRLKLPRPNKILYGHTHLATPAKDPFTLPVLPGVNFYNTGGWLLSDVSWPEIFYIDESRFESTRI